MAHVIGDIVGPLFGGGGAGVARTPLNPQAKAQLLAEMPFVSEPVGDDISDLADKTPTGSGRNTRRLLLGAALGAASVFAIDRLLVRASRKRK